MGSGGLVGGEGQGVLVVRAEGGGIWIGKSRGKGAEGLEAGSPVSRECGDRDSRFVDTRGQRQAEFELRKGASGRGLMI